LKRAISPSNIHQTLNSKPDELLMLLKGVVSDWLRPTKISNKCQNCCVLLRGRLLTEISLWHCNLNITVGYWSLLLLSVSLLCSVQCVSQSCTLESSSVIVTTAGEQESQISVGPACPFSKLHRHCFSPHPVERRASACAINLVQKFLPLHLSMPETYAIIQWTTKIITNGHYYLNLICSNISVFLNILKSNKQTEQTKEWLTDQLTHSLFYAETPLSKNFHQLH
jgi:hypothetical protein